MIYYKPFTLLSVLYHVFFRCRVVIEEISKKFLFKTLRRYEFYILSMTHTLTRQHQHNGINRCYGENITAALEQEISTGAGTESFQKISERLF